MAEHRAYCRLDSLKSGELVTISGEEAQHAARVKRLSPGDAMSLLDGCGRTARAAVVAVAKSRLNGQWVLELRIEELREHPVRRPRLEIWSAVPKGGRLDELIDQLSQVGASAWAPLDTARSVAEPTKNKASRLDRIVRESAKQCGRPWLLELMAGGALAEALRAATVVVADAGGAPFTAGSHAPADDSAPVRVLVGPEGGWTDAERAGARACGASFASFGPHTMRIETAATAAAAIVLHQFEHASHERRSS